MSKYIVILLWIGIAALFPSIWNVQRKEVVLGRQVKRAEPWFALFIFLPLLYMTATRGAFADTYLYLKIFEAMPDTLREIPAYLGTVKKDAGFSLVSAVIHAVFGNREVIYLGLIGIAQSAVLIRVYRKYSTNFLLSFFLFIASTDYVSWMLNGMRQFCAVTLIFSSTVFMLQKRWIPTVLLILAASTLHQSALLMLPIVFIVQGRAWNSRTLLFLLAVLTMVVFVDQFTDILDEMMQETQYANVVSDWKAWDDNGTNVIRVLVYAVPTILSVIGLYHIRAANDPVINLCTNMSIVSTGLYIVSMFTSGVFIGRLPIYASLYNYILLPWQLDNLFTERSAGFAKMAMVGMYLLFYFYQMHFAWSLI